MDEVRLGDIELLATEVATDAFSRGASDVTIVVCSVGAVLRVEIGDGPHPRRRRGAVFGDGRLRGHGLLLVEELSSSWGVEAVGSGRRFWFEVPASSTDRA